LFCLIVAMFESKQGKALVYNVAMIYQPEEIISYDYIILLSQLCSVLSSPVLVSLYGFQSVKSCQLVSVLLPVLFYPWSVIGCVNILPSLLLNILFFCISFVVTMLQYLTL